MNISKLLTTKKTVFSVHQIGQIFGVQNMNVLRVQLTRRKQQGFLQNPHYGIRAFPHYSPDELANALKTPSYISLETVLYKAGIVFQYYGTTIFSISNNTKSFLIDSTNYQYHKITPKILLNPAGILHHGGIATASIERAICDRLYLTPGYYFDNLRNVSRTKIFEVAEIYENRRLILDLTQLKNGTQY